MSRVRVEVLGVRDKVLGVRGNPLPSEFGTNTPVKTGFRPWLEPIRGWG